MQFPELPIREYCRVKISLNSGTTKISFSIELLVYLPFILLYTIWSMQFLCIVFNTLKKNSLSLGIPFVNNSGIYSDKDMNVSHYLSEIFIVSMTFFGVNSSYRGTVIKLI